MLNSVKDRNSRWTDFALNLRCSSSPRCYSTRARNVVEGRVFKAFVLLMILSNALFIGVSTHITMATTIEEYNRHPGEVGDVTYLLPQWITTVDMFFTLFFLFEIMARLVALEREFVTGYDWTWNIFDAILVATSIADVVLSAIYLNLSFVRVLRVVRLRFVPRSCGGDAVGSGLLTSVFASSVCTAHDV